MSRYKIHTKAKEFSLHAFGGQTYELGTDDEKETVYDLKKFIITDIFPQENIELYRLRLIIKPNIDLTNVQVLHKLEDKDIYLFVDDREIGRPLTTYGNTTLKEPKGMCLVENVFYLIAGDSIYRVDRTNSDKVDYFSARKKNIPESQERIDNMVSIRYPQDICFSEQRKELYIAEQNTIKVCSTDGLLIREFGTGILKNCRGICIAEQTNNIYVTDIYKKTIFVFSLEGEFIHAIEGIIESPCGVCFSKKENGIYVINNQYKNRSINFFSYGTFELVRSFGSEHLDSPSYICMDEDEETLYVSDTNSVKVFSIDGKYKDTTIGQLSTPKKKDDRQMRIIGTAYSGRPIEEILNPAGLVVSKQKLYVADRRGRILCFQV